MCVYIYIYIYIYIYVYVYMVSEVCLLLPAEALLPNGDVVFVQLLRGVRLRYAQVDRSAKLTGKYGKVDSQLRQS